MIVKRALVLVLVLGLIVLVAGCSGKKDTAQTDTTQMEDTTPDIEPPPTEEPVATPPVVQEPQTPTLGDVFFAFDKYNLTQESKGILQENATELNKFAGFDIVIEGHCDERGTVAYNLALGEKRAAAARDYLVSLGVNTDRITIISYGKSRPFATGHDETAWAKNRRGHFVIKQ